MKKLKIIVLQGIPGSGKSTWARKFIKNDSKNWVIVSRDSIRNSLGKYWVPSREGLISRIEKITISESIYNGCNVIIDATNLNPKTIKSWKNKKNQLNDTFRRLKKDIIVELEFKEFKISLRKAIWRDWKRGVFGRSVGSKVVKIFYNKYYDKT